MIWENEQQTVDLLQQIKVEFLPFANVSTKKQKLTFNEFLQIKLKQGIAKMNSRKKFYSMFNQLWLLILTFVLLVYVQV